MKGKDSAQKAWNKLSPSPELLEQILRVIDIQTDSEDWIKDEGKYIIQSAPQVDELLDILEVWTGNLNNVIPA